MLHPASAARRAGGIRRAVASALARREMSAISMSSSYEELAPHAIRSPWPEVPCPDKHVTDHVFEHAHEHPDQVALVDAVSDRGLTYGQLRHQIDALAGALRTGLGLAEGDVVGIHAPNIPEYAAVFHGVAVAGAVSTPSSPLFQAEELAFQFREAGAKACVTVAPLADVVMEAARAVGMPAERVIVMGEADAVPEGCTSYAALIAAGHAPPQVEVNPEAVVTVPFSSGTTGRPKGVCLTHRNLTTNVEQIIGVDPLRRGQTLLGVLPFYHIYGLTAILNYALRSGTRVVTNPRFDPQLFLRTLQDYGVERAHVAPPLVVFLAKHPLVDEYDLSALKVLFSGAAPLGSETEVAVSQRLGCLVKSAYGMTELAPASHITPDRDVVQGSVGPLVPNCEALIVDTSDGARVVAPGEEGELWVRGPNVMTGYLNRPEATADTVLPSGFLRTGDLAVCDERGYFRIVDRLKELIKYKGHQVSPAELEHLLLDHEGIADAAVVPTIDEEGEEIPKAFIVRRGDAELDEEAVMGHVARHVAPFKQVRAVEFIDEVPKSAAGKILRRVLVERERERRRQ